ncbi:hypothetical protein [Rasiella sp. SM2506]|uniref:hypothetical protein n=1 Tax=Rasiella sp. SM2506 TaxID=3423914 RepID=UPI003D795813
MGFSSKKYELKVALAAGLYPFLHYYNGNFDMADSWLQLGFLVALCFVVPVVIMLLSKPVFKLGFLQKLEKYRITGVNLVMFSGLIAMLILLGNKKFIAVVIFCAAVLSFLMYRYIKKIVVIQFLLASLSAITLLPRLWFMIQYDADWTEISSELKNVQLQQKPNIYVIQPDGYANFSHLSQPPYNFDNSAFEGYLSDQGFVNHPNYRSNYYSTLTSNAALFAMKHHYYQNTYPGNLKTLGAQEVVVGGYNNALNILKNNGYTSHFITDNSYFLINGKQTAFDHYNIERKQIKIYDTGPVRGADIIPDFEVTMSNLPQGANFVFIEKTLPSHVNHQKKYTVGIAGERAGYLNRVAQANEWLTSLIEIINTYDDNPMIILVADHGGYVGLQYVQEVETRKINAEETISSFNSMLSIKWPKGYTPKHTNIKTSVNMFRTIFAELANDDAILEAKEPNVSYIPLYDSFLGAHFYKCIDEDYKVVFEKIE